MLSVGENSEIDFLVQELSLSCPTFTSLVELMAQKKRL